MAGFYFGIAGFTGSEFQLAKIEIERQRDSLDAIKIAPPVQIGKDKTLITSVYDEKMVTTNLELDHRFRFMHNLNYKESLILLSLSFSLFGGCIQILIIILYAQQKLTDTSFYLTLLLSLLTGIVMFCITIKLPALINKELVNADVTPELLMLTALIGGIFTKMIYEKLSNYIK